MYTFFFAISKYLTINFVNNGFSVVIFVITSTMRVILAEKKNNFSCLIMLFKPGICRPAFSSNFIGISFLTTGFVTISTTSELRSGKNKFIFAFIQGMLINFLNTFKAVVIITFNVGSKKQQKNRF